jgi:hypothetical protein
VIRYPILYSGVGRILVLLGLPRSRAEVVVDGATLRVRLGWGFRATAPLASITSVQRVPDARAGWGWGAHGWGGHWLVNGSLRNIVRVGIDPPARARVAGIPVRLHTLDVSLEDPDRFVAEVGPG